MWRVPVFAILFTITPAIHVCAQLADGDGSDFPETGTLCQGNSPDVIIGSLLGNRVLGDAPLTNTGDDFQGSCNTHLEGGLDIAVNWTVPADGDYTIDTFGSTFDTILYVLDGDCGTGAELQCNDDFGVLQSAITLNGLAASTRLTVVVEGFGLSESGPVFLNINRAGPAETECLDTLDNDNDGDADCDDPDCRTSANCTGRGCPDVSIGENTGLNVLGPTQPTGVSDHFESCGEAGGVDLAVGWTVPLDGDYQINTFDSSFDTVLTVLNGDCTGDMLACNDDDADLVQSALDLIGLIAGTNLTIIVDGYRGTETGPVFLNIQRLAEMETDCRDGVDNDGDGDADCADADCAAVVECKDSDDDGHTDAAELAAGSDAGNADSQPGATRVTLVVGYNQINFPAESGIHDDLRALLNSAFGGAAVVDFVDQLDPLTQTFSTSIFEGSELLSGPITPDRFNQELPGLLVYSLRDIELDFTSIFCPTWKLEPGVNLVGSPCIPQPSTARDFFFAISDDTDPITIQRFDPRRGAFQSFFYRNGEFSGINFPLIAGEAYLIHLEVMKLFDPRDILISAAQPL